MRSTPAVSDFDFFVAGSLSSSLSITRLRFIPLVRVTPVAPAGLRLSLKRLIAFEVSLLLTFAFPDRGRTRGGECDVAGDRGS